MKKCRKVISFNSFQTTPGSEIPWGSKDSQSFDVDFTQDGFTRTYILQENTPRNARVNIIRGRAGYHIDQQHKRDSLENKVFMVE